MWWWCCVADSERVLLQINFSANSVTGTVFEFSLLNYECITVSSFFLQYLSGMIGFQVKGERGAVEEVSSSTGHPRFFHHQNRFTEEQMRSIESQQNRFSQAQNRFMEGQNRFPEAMRVGVLAGPAFSRAADEFCKVPVYACGILSSKM